MLNNQDYEILKESFVNSQRLFDKLNALADKASELEYDESGMFIEEEELYKKHFSKLSSKILDALQENLEGYRLSVLQNDSLETRELKIELLKKNDLSEILVDYSDRNALSISQLS